MICGNCKKKVILEKKTQPTLLNFRSFHTEYEAFLMIYKLLKRDLEIKRTNWLNKFSFELMHLKSKHQAGFLKMRRVVDNYYHLNGDRTKKNSHVSPGHLPPGHSLPLDRYPWDIYIPQTYIPHNLKYLIWLMLHMLITFCTHLFCRNCFYL